MRNLLDILKFCYLDFIIIEKISRELGIYVLFMD